MYIHVGGSIQTINHYIKLVLALRGGTYTVYTTICNVMLFTVNLLVHGLLKVNFIAMKVMWYT